ncbi:hypothetical protein NHJ13734_009662 [Beauveria thailandica]
MDANSTDNNGYLPVFDTCDVVRRKIRNFLKKSALSKAAFLRTVSKDVINCPDFQVGQLNRFLALKGPRKGNTCGVYYAAYVFFEQRRIQDRQPKSAERIEMERLHPYGSPTALPPPSLCPTPIYDCKLRPTAMPSRTESHLGRKRLGDAASDAELRLSLGGD